MNFGEELRFIWLVVFNAPSTARSFRDSAPIYCPRPANCDK